MLRLNYGAIRDGKRIQSFAKFQLKIYIRFQIDVFFGVSVLTAEGPYFSVGKKTEFYQPLTSPSLLKCTLLQILSGDP